MCRSEPHTPVASMRTIASSRSSSSGSGRSSTLTTPGAWKVTARIRAGSLSICVGASPAGLVRLDGAQGARLGVEDEAADVVARGQLAAVAQSPEAVDERRLDVLEGAEPPRRQDPVGGERLGELVLGSAVQAAALVHHDDDLLRAEQALGGAERANRVVGHKPAGVADD